MANRITDWLRTEHRPRHLYELLGRPLLDPDRDGLRQAVRAANRELFDYQSHENPVLARRALDLLAELGRVRGILENPAKLAAHDGQVLDELRAGYAAHRPFAPAKDDLRGWLSREHHLNEADASRIAALFSAAPPEAVADPLIPYPIVIEPAEIEPDRDQPPLAELDTMAEDVAFNTTAAVPIPARKSRPPSSPDLSPRPVHGDRPSPSTKTARRLAVVPPLAEELVPEPSRRMSGVLVLLAGLAATVIVGVGLTVAVLGWPRSNRPPVAEVTAPAETPRPEPPPPTRSAPKPTVPIDPPAPEPKTTPEPDEQPAPKPQVVKPKIGAEPDDRPAPKASNPFRGQPAPKPEPPKPTTSKPSSPASVRELAKRAIVIVESKRGQKKGFLVGTSPNMVVMSARDRQDLIDDLTVRSAQAGPSAGQPARLVYDYRDRDIALLAVTAPSGVRPLSLAADFKPDAPADVFIGGGPDLVSASCGDLIQHLGLFYFPVTKTGALEPGCPVLDPTGKVIGMTTTRGPEGKNRPADTTYAVPITAVADAVEQLDSDRRTLDEIMLNVYLNARIASLIIDFRVGVSGGFRFSNVQTLLDVDAELRTMFDKVDRDRPKFRLNTMAVMPELASRQKLVYDLREYRKELRSIAMTRDFPATTTKRAKTVIAKCESMMRPYLSEKKLSDEDVLKQMVELMQKAGIDVELTPARRR